METSGYLELLFNDSPNACYFADVDQHEIIFMNKVMVKKLHNYDDFAGKKCYNVIHNLNAPCNFCPMDSLKDSEFIEQRIFNELTRNYHRANSTLMEVNGQKMCACKYFVAFPEEKKPQLTYEKAIEKCVDILKTCDKAVAIREFIALMGQFYNTESSFIFDLNQETNTFSPVYFWKAEKDSPQISPDVDQNFKDDFSLWVTAVTMSGMVEVNASKNYPDSSFEKKLLSQFQVKNLIISPVKNRIGKIMGFVGLSNHKVDNFDARLIQAITRFVEENHSKNVMVSELKAVNYLDEQTGFFNRKRYVELVHELEEAPPHSLGVVFVSLADLRRVNDRRGFAEGNQLIRQSANFLKVTFSEAFYRITGDEFICFVSDSLEGEFYKRVRELEERLRQEKSVQLNVGCSWDNGKINVLQLVADADNNVHEY